MNLASVTSVTEVTDLAGPSAAARLIEVTP
jgi:hypothetical protein